MTIDARAERLRDRSEAVATPLPIPQTKHPFALDEPSPRHEHPVGGLEDEREGGRLLERELVRQRIDVVGRERDQLGVRPVHVLAHDLGAVVEAGVDDDGVALREAVDALAEPDDDAGSVGARESAAWARRGARGGARCRDG